MRGDQLRHLEESFALLDFHFVLLQARSFTIALSAGICDDHVNLHGTGRSLLLPIDKPAADSECTEHSEVDTNALAVLHDDPHRVGMSDKFLPLRPYINHIDRAENTAVAG